MALCCCRLELMQGGLAATNQVVAAINVMIKDLQASGELVYWNQLGRAVGGTARKSLWDRMLSHLQQQAAVFVTATQLRHGCLQRAPHWVQVVVHHLRGGTRVGRRLHVSPGAAAKGWQSETAASKWAEQHRLAPLTSVFRTGAHSPLCRNLLMRTKGSLLPHVSLFSSLEAPSVSWTCREGRGVARLGGCRRA